MHKRKGYDNSNSKRRGLPGGLRAPEHEYSKKKTTTQIQKENTDVNIIRKNEEYLLKS